MKVSSTAMNSPAVDMALAAPMGKSAPPSATPRRSALPCRDGGSPGSECEVGLGIAVGQRGPGGGCSARSGEKPAVLEKMRRRLPVARCCAFLRSMPLEP